MRFEESQAMKIVLSPFVACPDCTDGKESYPLMAQRGSDLELPDGPVYINHVVVVVVVAL